VSPTHQAAHGLVDPTKGIALRFPRFLRVRDDKIVETSTSAEQVAEFYNAQATKVEFEKEDEDAF
jgi:DNA ligase-1